VSDAPEPSAADTPSLRHEANAPALIAHRGFAGEHPENTCPAFEAASHHADMVELDVVATGDGDVVVFHDETLAGRDDGGLTDATGVVCETPTPTVTSAEVLDSGATVPRLSDALASIPADVGVNVELKHPGRPGLEFDRKLTEERLTERTAVWRPFVERVVEVVADTDNDILLSSFCEGALAAATESSSYPVAPIIWQSPEDGLAIAREHDAAAIHPHIALIDGTPFESDAADGLVETAHAAGCAVNAWTVTTWYQAARLAEAGVDGIISDYAGVV